MQRYETIGVGSMQHRVPRTLTNHLRPTQNIDLNRTQTVEFAPQRRPERQNTGRHQDFISEGGRVDTIMSDDQRGTHRTSAYSGFPSFPTQHSHRPHRIKHSGFGGFPMPHEIIGVLINRFFPKLERKLTRTVTMPLTTTMASRMGTTLAPYISFDAVVGRNSAFHDLTHNQIEELGGVEYRALNALLWIVAGVSQTSSCQVFGARAEYESSTTSASS